MSLPKRNRLGERCRSVLSDSPNGDLRAIPPAAGSLDRAFFPPEAMVAARLRSQVQIRVPYPPALESRGPWPRVTPENGAESGMGEVGRRFVDSAATPR